MLISPLPFFTPRRNDPIPHICLGHIRIRPFGFDLDMYFLLPVCICLAVLNVLQIYEGLTQWPAILNVVIFSTAFVQFWRWVGYHTQSRVEKYSISGWSSLMMSLDLYITQDPILWRGNTLWIVTSNLEARDLYFDIDPAVYIGPVLIHSWPGPMWYDTWAKTKVCPM